MKIVQLLLSIKNNNRAIHYVIISFSVGSKKLLFKLILRIKISIHTKDLFVLKRKVFKKYF